jgi:hypothetical protein
MMGLHLFDLGGKWFLGNHPSIHPSIHHDKTRKFNSCAKNNCNGKLDRRAHIRKPLWGTHWELGEQIVIRSSVFKKYI